MDRKKNQYKTNQTNALEEVRLLGGMQHPYVVQFMEAFLDTKNEQLCLVQEFMNSDNLESLINSRANKNAEDNIFFEESIVWKCLI